MGIKTRELLFRHGFGYVWVADEMTDRKILNIGLLIVASKTGVHFVFRQNKALQIYNASIKGCKLCLFSYTATILQFKISK